MHVNRQQDVQGAWPDKIDYRITVPSQHRQWGQPITATFSLQPLTKGITVESVVLKLQELLCLKASSSNRQLFHRKETTISGMEAIKNENPELDLQLETRALEDQLEMVLPLPRSLHLCRQSVHQDRIIISHRLMVDLRLRDNSGTEYLVKAL